MRENTGPPGQDCDSPPGETEKTGRPPGGLPTPGSAVDRWGKVAAESYPREPVVMDPEQAREPGKTDGKRVARTEYRAQLVADAFGVLQNDPRDANQAYATLAERVRALWPDGPPGPDGITVADFEVARTLWGATAAFFQDMAVANGIQQVRKYGWHGHPVATLVPELQESPRGFHTADIYLPPKIGADTVVPHTAALPPGHPRAWVHKPHAEFHYAMSAIMHRDLNLRDECGPGGKYEVAYAAYRAARNLSDAIINKWYDRFISEVGKGQKEDKGPVSEYQGEDSRKAFSDDLTLATLDKVYGGIVETVDTGAQFAVLFHYADYAMPPVQKQVIFQDSIPALEPVAFRSRAGLIDVMGEFLEELRNSPEPDLRRWQPLARRTLESIAPGADLRHGLRPLPAPPTPPRRAGRCPAHSITTDGGTAAEALLRLTSYVAKETYWKRRPEAPGSPEHLAPLPEE